MRLKSKNCQSWDLSAAAATFALPDIFGIIAIHSEDEGGLNTRHMHVSTSDSASKGFGGGGAD